jgi:hypothetical protein
VELVTPQQQQFEANHMFKWNSPANKAVLYSIPLTLFVLFIMAAVWNSLFGTVIPWQVALFVVFISMALGPASILRQMADNAAASRRKDD